MKEVAEKLKKFQHVWYRDHQTQQRECGVYIENYLRETWHNGISYRNNPIFKIIDINGKLTAVDWVAPIGK